MATNNITGIGAANGIGFKRHNVTGGKYISPDLLNKLVGVWSAYGKSNEDSDRNIIKNKLKDRGGDLEILNAAYKLDSGYGGYKIDFTSWGLDSIKGELIRTDSVLQFDTTRYSVLYLYPERVDYDIPSFKVKVSFQRTIEQINNLVWYYYDINGIKHLQRLTEGINILEASYVANMTEGVWTGIYAYPGVKCKVEQIPDYEGAFITNGVDNLIVSQKTVKEMLGGSNEITVVSMIHHITGTDVSSFNSVRNFTSVTGRNRLNINNNPINKTGIYGWSRSNLNIVQATTMINNVLGDNKDYQTINNDILSNDSLYSVEGYNAENGAQEVSQVAWYWTFIANRVLTTDEINQVIAYYNLDKYVKPDIYYDVKKQGLSNNTSDADWYLKDFSGNGRDMQLYNYGKTPESGINEEGGLQSDGVTDYGQFVGDLGLKDYTVAVDRAYVEAKGSQVPIISNVVDGSVNTPFLMEHLGIEKILAPHSFGRYTALSELNINRFISYQSTYKYNGSDIIKGTSTDAGSGLTIGRYGGSSSQYANIALWSLLLFPYTLSEFLLERQLKRYKLGTLYPNMLEFRPIITGNIPYNAIGINQGSTILYNPVIDKTGTYLAEGSIVRVYIRPSTIDEVSKITINGVSYTDLPININGYYYADFPITKSPQKIDITIDEYIRYEDIVQPYPAVINLKQDGKAITWGDKLKVGSEITFVNHTNLLPELYTIGGGVQYNGTSITWNTPIRVEKSMVFTNIHGYKKANEPNCIADPQRLRIPNSSYKILGYIPDISGHGNHLKINNSAYAGMSGANGYVEDFTTWGIYGGMYGGVILTDSTIKTNSDFRSQDSWVAYKGANKTLNSFSVNITGIPKEGILTFRVNADTYIELSNGRNDLSFDNLLITVSSGFRITKGSNLDWSNLVIEQIGEYEGSFCLDGVEDYLTIPTLSHGAKQVLMKVNLQKYDTYLYDQRNSWSQQLAIVSAGNKIAYEYSNQGGKTYIDGILNEHIIDRDLVGITHNITVTNNSSGNQYPPNIGTSFAKGNFAQMALFTFMSFDDISSEEEIKELNDIVGIEGDYVESPEYYWDAYGKANRATQDIDYLDLNQASNAHQVLIDKSKAGLTALELYHNTGNVAELNNRRLIANNFAYNEESGYGGISSIYKFATDPISGQWQYYSDRVSFEVLNDGNSVRITEAKSGAALFYLGFSSKAYYKVSGLSTGFGIKFGSDGNSTWEMIIEEDGVYEVDWTLNVNTNGEHIANCIMTNGWRGQCDITIEQVSQYPNGLLNDGVDDHLINTVIPTFTDFTVIAKRQFLNSVLQNDEVFCYKGDKLYLSTIGNAFCMEYNYNGINRVSSFGNLKMVPLEASKISYLTSTSYNGTTITKGDKEDTIGLMIGSVEVFTGKEYSTR